MTLPPFPAAALLAVASSAAALASPPIGEDFNAGDPSRWAPNDPLATIFGPTSFAIANGAYRITSQPLPPVPAFIGAGSGLIPSLADPQEYADGTLRFSVRFHNAATNAGMFARTTPTVDAGYFLFLNNVENSIGIADVAVGAGNIVVAPYPLAEGIAYSVEATMLGSSLSMTVWPAGTSKPAAPQLLLDDELYAAGGLATIVYSQSSASGGVGGILDASFDDVVFTPAGARLLDDFTAGLDAWTPLVLGGTQPTFAASEGRARIGSNQPAANTDIALLAYLPSLAAPADHSDGTLRATFTVRDSNANLYLRGDPIALTSYATTFRPTDGDLSLLRSDGTSEAVLATTTVPYGNDEELVVECSAIGDSFEVRIWAVGEARPKEPQLTATDATYALGGIAIGTDGPAVIAKPAPFDAEFGDVWFIPGVPSCAPADLDCDGSVGPADLAILLGAWGGSGPADLDGDGSVDAADLALLLGAWGR